jgi:hypothetical protein
MLTLLCWLLNASTKILRPNMCLHRRHLARLFICYVDFYDQKRPHQGIGQRIPTRFTESRQPLSNKAKGRIVSTPVLFGLHHC